MRSAICEVSSREQAMVGSEKGGMAEKRIGPQETGWKSAERSEKR